MYPKMYNENWKDSSVRKFAYKIGNYLEQIELLNIADSKNYNNELFKRVENLKKQNLLIPKEDLFNGNELIKIFNKPSGKWIGEVKQFIRNLQTEDPNISKQDVIDKVKIFIER